MAHQSQDYNESHFEQLKGHLRVNFKGKLLIPFVNIKFKVFGSPVKNFPKGLGYSCGSHYSGNSGERQKKQRKPVLSKGRKKRIRPREERVSGRKKQATMPKPMRIRTQNHMLNLTKLADFCQSFHRMGEGRNMAVVYEGLHVARAIAV